MTAPAVILGSWGRAPVPGDIGVDRVELCFTRQTLSRGDRKCRLPRIDFMMAAALVSASPVLISYAELFDGIYADRRDGGPIDPGNIVAVRLCSIRRATAELGIRFITVWGRGLRVELEAFPSRPARDTAPSRPVSSSALPGACRGLPRDPSPSSSPAHAPASSHHLSARV